MSGGVGEGGEGEGPPGGGSLMFGSAAAAAAVLGDCLVPRSGTAACCGVATSLLFRSAKLLLYRPAKKTKNRKRLQ
jgi:hypothetical protein